MDFKKIKNLYHERHLTPEELKDREEYAKAIEKSHPGMGSTKSGMGMKMAIATNLAKEEVESLDEIANYNLVVNYYRHLGLDPYKLRGQQGKILRDKIKISPAFNAWLKHNSDHSEYNRVKRSPFGGAKSLIRSGYEYEGKYSLVIAELKSAKKESRGKVKVDIKFLGGYNNDANSSPSQTDKEITNVDTNYTTDR
jgi:hypothetical protein